MCLAFDLIYTHLFFRLFYFFFIFWLVILRRVCKMHEFSAFSTRFTLLNSMSTVG